MSWILYIMVTLGIVYAIVLFANWAANGQARSGVVIHRTTSGARAYIAGEKLKAGDPVYIGDDGKLYKANPGIVPEPLLHPVNSGKEGV